MLGLIALGAFLLGLVAGVLATRLRARAGDDRAGALQRSRARILADAQEERRRLRKSLHDDLGPTLASLAMALDTARLTLNHRPEQVGPQLADLRGRLAGAVGTIRELVADLRPPALDDLGLAGAVHGLADGAEGILVRVRITDDLADLPAAVEVAAYLIVQEALANVRRHAQAPSATVRLRRGPDAVHLVVSDHGRGLRPGRAEGAGIAAMRERAAEVGGVCTVGPRPGGGTAVIARLPLTQLPEEHPRVR
ncbi:sensor histidine kinase [Actinocorallia sp. API 0066]|uniref:sensor histidine kinase n=1 Tax=Actinocorallia sp. API 0066 TaxID=2896846 RepID=UPI001E37532E|nr:sensor histidine kinase [Actinocorallia sp. API 0066]MCD0452857.1 sensor histidine kinase [Actinocorallia sp. API 0066]